MHAGKFYFNPIILTFNFLFPLQSSEPFSKLSRASLKLNGVHILLEGFVCQKVLIRLVEYSLGLGFPFFILIKLKIESNFLSI